MQEIHNLAQGNLSRIAWLGPVGEGGGVAGMGAILLQGILRQGIRVDYYCSFEQVPDSLRQDENLTIISTPPCWEWDRWYSRNPFGAFVSGTLARTRAYNRLSSMLLEQHAINSYDCVFQLSQTELLKLGQNLHRLPPIIVFPCVHTAGELRWHRHESAYALQSESFWMHYLARAFLMYRSRTQKHELVKPALIIGMSQRFNDLVAADYSVSSKRQSVLYHPIPPQDEAAARAADEIAACRTNIKLLFIARISVRKGLQYIIELSKRLDNLTGQVQIDLIGGFTQWSDYRAHLKDLNPRTACYLGGMNHPDISAAYDAADILLAPSLYEPGGIVVGEALSHGVCVVASDEVGSAEVLDGDCHRAFPAGNMDQFEQQVRSLIKDLEMRRQELRQCAREQAQKHFAPEKIVKELAILLKHVATVNGKNTANPLHPREEVPID